MTRGPPAAGIRKAHACVMSVTEPSGPQVPGDASGLGMLNPWPCKPRIKSSSTFNDIYKRKLTHIHCPACPKRHRHTVVAARRTETWRRERKATEGLTATTGARTDFPCATEAVEGLELSVCACHREEGEHLLLGPRRNRCRFERHCPSDASGPQLPAWCEDRAT